MKTLLIGLLALVITLGVFAKPETKLNNPPIGGYPGGENVFPHNTGICYCGAYSTCHPVQHSAQCRSMQMQGFACDGTCMGIY